MYRWSCECLLRKSCTSAIYVPDPSPITYFATISAESKHHESKCVKNIYWHGQLYDGPEDLCLSASAVDRFAHEF